MDQTKERYRWLDVAAVARRLTLCKTSVYGLCKEGHLLAARFGKASIRVRSDSVDAYIERQISKFALEE